MAHLLKFTPDVGAVFTFPKGFSLVQDTDRQNIPSTQVPRRDGEHALRGTRLARDIQIRGSLFANLLGCTTPRQSVAVIKSALYSTIGSLQFDDDRALRNVQCDNISESYTPNGYGRLADLNLSFKAYDPFFYSLVASTATWATPTDGALFAINDTISSKFSLPQITVTLSAAAWVDFTLTVQENSTKLQVTGTPTHNIFTIDCTTQKVTYADGSDAMAMIDLQFLRLQPGVSTVRLNNIGAQVASVSSIAFSWYPRYSE